MKTNSHSHTRGGLEKTRQTVQSMRIRQLREMRGLDTAYVAKWLGMSEEMYRLVEAAAFDIQATELAELAVLYGVTTDFILGLSDDLEAAGRIHREDSIEFMRMMLECRVENKGLFSKFRQVLHEAATEPDSDVTAVFIKHFPQHRTELEKLAQSR